MADVICPECTLINPPNALLCESCGATLGSTSCGSCEDADNFLLLARSFWDGDSDVCISGECGVCMVVMGELIAWLGLLEYLPDEYRDLSIAFDGIALGATLMPGLIDAHVHLEADPAHELARQPRLSDDELMRRMRRRASNMLSHGITTARDLGGIGHVLKLRDAILRGDCVGPRLVCAGQPITRVRGHCHFWGGEADGEDGIISVVNRQADELRVDLIKIMATGGVRTPGTDPSKAAFSRREMEITVQTARQRGLVVAAHAHGLEGIGNAVDAGVHSIEHCSWVDGSGSWGRYDDELVQRIARAGIYISPTIGAGWATKPGLTGSMGPALKRMRAAGVRFAASTDAGAIPDLAHHRLADGLLVLARSAGMSNAEGLRAATTVGAAALGLEAVTGALREGLCADVLVVRADPIEEYETAVCAPPLAIVCRGKLVTPCRGDLRQAGGGWGGSWGGGVPSWITAGGSSFGSSARCPCNV